jgi:hypothetical protein
MLRFSCGVCGWNQKACDRTAVNASLGDSRRTVGRPQGSESSTRSSAKKADGSDVVHAPRLEG